MSEKTYGSITFTTDSDYEINVELNDLKSRQQESASAISANSPWTDPWYGTMKISYDRTYSYCGVTNRGDFFYCYAGDDFKVCNVEGTATTDSSAEIERWEVSSENGTTDLIVDGSAHNMLFEEGANYTVKACFKAQ